MRALHHYAHPYQRAIPLSQMAVNACIDAMPPGSKRRAALTQWLPQRAVVELSTPMLTVSPFEVTGCPWSGRVFSTSGPSVDWPLESVTPDSVWFAATESAGPVPLESCDPPPCPVLALSTPMLTVSPF